MTSSFLSCEFEACIDALWVFPIKSCAGIAVTQAVLTPTGLAHDRAWMVVDAQGEMVTQRDLPRMALIQPELLLAHGRPISMVLHAKGMSALQLPAVAENYPSRVRVRVWNDEVPAFDVGAQASAWLTEFLGLSLGPLRLVRFDTQHARHSSAQWTQGVSALNQFSDGFPLLVVSSASLDELNARLIKTGETAVDMRRFRANIVLGAMANASVLMPHDEDRVDMFTLDTEGGVAQLKPVKPCPRCPIPNIDPDSAQSHPAVNDTLQTYRKDSRLNGATTFGMNCVPVAGLSQVLRLGQRVSANWKF